MTMSSLPQHHRSRPPNAKLRDNNRRSSEQELRQRRARILKEKEYHQAEQRIVKASVQRTAGGNSSYFIQVFLVVFTALVILAGTVLRYAQPKLFSRLWKRRNVPPYYFATKYPSTVILERDLPRFYQTYSIATAENQVARDAVQKIIRSRTQLRHRLGDTKAILKAWDDANVESLVQHRGLCGDDFSEAFGNASPTKQEDLLMWCLIATRIVEGYFKESVEMIDSAIFLTRQRGMVVKKQGHGALSTSYYLHPRLNNTSLEWLPSKALAMAITMEENLEHYLYDLVQGNQDDYLILDEVCQDELPERAIGKDCDNSNENCCYFVVPEQYGGRFTLHDDDEDED